VFKITSKDPLSTQSLINANDGIKDLVRSEKEK
jgi:hypothetical protein